MIIVLIILIISFIIISSILWWRYVQREEMWNKYIRIGDPVYVELRGKRGYLNYTVVGKKIVDYTKDGVRLQHIGWVSKRKFLNGSYIDEYGRLFVRLKK